MKVDEAGGRRRKEEGDGGRRWMKDDGGPGRWSDNKDDSTSPLMPTHTHTRTRAHTHTRSEHPVRPVSITLDTYDYGFPPSRDL